MKKRTNLLAGLILATSTVPMLMGNTVADFSATEYPFDKIMIQCGRDSTELNLNWISYEMPEVVVVQVAKKEDFKNGVFPEANSRSFEGTFGKMQGRNIDGKNYFAYDNEAVVSGLLPNTEYVYRVGDGNEWSEAYTYVTPDTDSYRMFVVSDVHMNASKHTTEECNQDWGGNLTQLMARHADLGISHILSLGDQVQDADRMDYIDALLEPKELRSLSFAPINGNHDISPYHTELKKYFNAPNIAKEGDETYTGYGIEDYYYLYGNTLFVMLNYENTLKAKGVNMGHWEKTFEKATTEYAGRYDWLVACTHDPVYGVGYTTADSDAGMNLADDLEMFEKQYLRGKSFIDSCDKYGVDLVLTGHTHAYGRSYFMKGGEVMDNVETERDGVEEYIDPQGTVYVNSSTSNTLSHLSTGNPDDNELYGRGAYTEIPWLKERYWTSDMSGYGRSTYSVLESDENYLKITSWEVDRPENLVDEFVITKTSIVPDEGNEGNEGNQGGNVTDPPIDSGSSGDNSNTNNNSSSDGGNGCAGAIGGSVALLALLPVAACFLFKKKQ